MCLIRPELVFKPNPQLVKRVKEAIEAEMATWKPWEGFTGTMEGEFGPVVAYTPWWNCRLTDKHGNQWKPVFKRKTYFTGKTYKVSEFVECWDCGKEQFPAHAPFDMNKLFVEWATGVWPLENFEYTIRPEAEISLNLVSEEGWVGVWDVK